MRLDDVHDWIVDFHKQRGWDGKDPSLTMQYVIEELGEVAQAIRIFEGRRATERPNEEKKVVTKQNIAEEIGDVIDGLVMLADYYGLKLGDVFQAYHEKMIRRYSNAKNDV